jgi:hypothetical protein
MSRSPIQDLVLREHALWTALTSGNPGPAVAKMCRPDDAVLLFPRMPILSLHGETSLLSALQPKFHRFDNYSLDDMNVAVVGSSAGVVSYKVVAARGSSAYNASASTTWGLGSDGEWRVVCHQETLL